MENNTPLSRVEDILQSTIDNTEYDKPPQSRVESLLIELKEVIEGGGGGGSAYHPAGSVDYVSELPSPSADYLGYVYDITQDFTTTSDFKEGAGKRYPAGSNIAIVDVGTPESPSYKYDVLSGFIDTSNFVEKEEGKGLSTNDYTNADKTKLSGIAEGAEVNVQSDWNESDNSSDAYIQNKPTLGTASALNVAESGNAGNNEVVKGNDSRLTDDRNPTPHTHSVSQITDFPALGTAAGLNVPATGDAGSSEVVKGNDSRVVNSPIASTTTGINPTITDSANGYMQDLTVHGRSDTVEGELRGIGEGGTLNVVTCGKNLMNPALFEDNKYQNYSSTDHTIIDSTTYWITGKQKVVPGQTYKISLNGAPFNAYGVIYGANERILYNVSSFTAQEGDESFCFNCNKSNVAYGSNLQLELGSIATAYEPYVFTSAAVTTGIPLYAVGNVKDELDEKRGVVVKRCGVADLGDLDWTRIVSSSNYFKTASLNANIKRPLDAYELPNAICTKYSAHQWAGATPDKHFVIEPIAVSTYTENLMIVDNDYSDPTTFKTAVTGVKLVYELAEPYEIPLTASEITQLRNLRTYSPTTNVTVTDNPTSTVGYLLNTDNGQAVANVQNEIDNRKTEIDDATPSDTKTYSSNKINALIQGSAWKFGYDIDLSDENPATRVIYPPDVDNYLFTPAYMDFANDVFNYSSWNIRPGEKFMPKPCMLKYDGSVDYFLDIDDNTKKEDSTASDVANTAYGGNAMIQWGLLYIKRWESNGIYHFRVSNEKLDADYECWSNYDINNNVIPHFYTSVYFGGDDGSGKMRSLSGISNYVNHTAAEEITAAMANGDDWYTEVFADQKLLEDLAVMMAKTTDVQTAYGKGRSESSSALAPGALNTKGVFWGENAGTGGVKLFGMENPFGNIWRRKAGYMMINGTQYVKMTRGTKDGSTAVDYNTTGAGYIQIPSSDITGTSSGYINSMMTTPYGRLPKGVSGSQTTYEADGCWWNRDETRYALFGGGWGYGRQVGVFFVRLDPAPSGVAPNVGASLSYKPRG